MDASSTMVRLSSNYFYLVKHNADHLNTMICNTSEHKIDTLIKI